MFIRYLLSTQYKNKQRIHQGRNREADIYTITSKLNQLFSKVLYTRTQIVNLQIRKLVLCSCFYYYHRRIPRHMEQHNNTAEQQRCQLQRASGGIDVVCVTKRRRIPPEERERDRAHPLGTSPTMRPPCRTSGGVREGALTSPLAPRDHQRYYYYY